MPVTIVLVICISDGLYCAVQVIGVAPKPAVVQNLSAVSERGSQPRIQAVITETKKEPPATFSQVSPITPSSSLHPQSGFYLAKKTNYTLKLDNMEAIEKQPHHPSTGSI